MLFPIIRGNGRGYGTGMGMKSGTNFGLNGIFNVSFCIEL